MSALIALLRLRGTAFSPLPSPLGDRPYRGYFVEFTRRMLNFGLEHIEPAILPVLDDLGLSGELERRRTARYLLLANLRMVMRQTEIAEAARLLGHDGKPVTLLVESNVLRPAFAAFAAGLGLNASFYSAPLRLGMARRSGFHAHETALWSGEATWRHIARWIATFCRAALGWMRAANSSGDERNLDVIALSARPAPSSNIDDLYWLDPLERRCDARVALYYTIPLTAEAAAFYDKRLDGPHNVTDAIVGRGEAGRHSSLVHRQHLRAMIVGAKHAAAAVRGGKLPLAFGAALLTLWERSGFYEALMNESGARVAWAMNEGHELNTQAIAIAAARLGGVVAGATWSMWDVPHLDSAFNRNDVMFAWGERQIGIFEQSGAIIERFVLTGYPTARAALDDPSAGEIADTWRRQDSDAVIVCLYDNAAATDFPATPSDVRDLFDAIVHEMEERPNLRLILKTKRRDLALLSSAARKRLDALISQGRAVVRDTYGDLSSGLAADAVIGISASSLALLSAHFGRTCIVFDPEGILSRFPANRLRDLRAIGAPDRLGPALAGVTQRKEHAPASPNSGDDVDGFGDTDGEERTAEYLEALIRAARGGIRGRDLIRHADEVAMPETRFTNLEKIA